MITKFFKGFTVPAIGQGAGGNEICDDHHRIKVLREGIDLGMTLIDTAEAYGDGYSEEIVGKAVMGRRTTVFIATKFSPAHNHYDGIVKALEGSLRRLGVDYIDLYQVHWPNPSVPIEESIMTLMDLKKAGKVLHIGTGNFSLRQLLQAEKVCSAPIESTQVEYNLLERGAEEDLLPYSRENGIMTIAYNPLLRGKKGTEALSAIAKKYNKSPTQVILNWLISHPTVVPIPKTLNLEHMKENALAADFKLEMGDISELERVFSRIIVDVPTNRIRVLPFDGEPAYTTIEEALENRYNLEPSPQELAKEILDNQFLKPIRLRPATEKNDRFDYDLIQGRVRYWAWVIAYNNDVPIPSYINE